MQQTVLHRIVRDKAEWIAARQEQQPLTTFQKKVVPSERSFYHALSGDKTVFILECKKASPSKGLIRHDFDLQKIAHSYKNYASAISVLTDEKYFQGDFAYLSLVSQEVHQPVLCKDFIIDPYQIYLARYYQADAILLMLSVLDDKQYKVLTDVAHRLNMGVLTEVSNEDELTRAIALQARVVGINNRDLRDLSIDLNRTRTLAPKLPKDITIISESGIHSYQQVRELSQYANGFLIGSALMSAENLDLAIREAIYGANKVCGLTRSIDAAAAYRAGAVYGGLIFVGSSPRYVDPAKARLVMSGAPLRWVGIFRHAKTDTIVQTVERLHLNAVQLHGNEDEHYVQGLRDRLPAECQIWQAYSVGERFPSIAHHNIDRVILDNAQGGSGEAFNWSLLDKQNLQSVMLAGGINPDNAKLASTLGCVGLDINSGVESAPGLKDSGKIDAVFNALRHY